MKFFLLSILILAALKHLCSGGTFLRSPWSRYYCCIIAFVWKWKGVHWPLYIFRFFLQCTTLLAVITVFSITLFGFLSSLAFNNRIENLTLIPKFRGPLIFGAPYFRGGGPWGSASFVCRSRRPWLWLN